MCVCEGGGGVLVEGVGVRCVGVAGDGAVGVENDGLQSLDQRLGVVLCGNGGAVVVEEGGTGSRYVAYVVVVLDAFASHGGCAVGQFGSEVGGLGESVDIGVPRAEFVGSLLSSTLVRMKAKSVEGNLRIRIGFRSPWEYILPQRC